MLVSGFIIFSLWESQRPTLLASLAEVVPGFPSNEKRSQTIASHPAHFRFSPLRRLTAEFMVSARADGGGKTPTANCIPQSVFSLDVLTTASQPNGSGIMIFFQSLQKRKEKVWTSLFLFHFLNLFIYIVYFYSHFSSLLNSKTGAPTFKGLAR